MEFASRIQIRGKLPHGPLVRISKKNIKKESVSQYSYLLLEYKSRVPIQIQKRLTLRKERKKRLQRPRIFARLRLETVPDDLFASFLEGDYERTLDNYRTGEHAMYLSYYEKVFGSNLAEGTRRANTKATYTTSVSNVQKALHTKFKTIPTEKGKQFSFFLHPQAAHNLKAYAEAFAASLGFSIMILRAQNYTLAYKVYKDYSPIHPIVPPLASCSDMRGPLLFKPLQELNPPYPWEEVEALCQRKEEEHLPS